MTHIEILGYLASAFVALSLLMGDIKKLRYVNVVGCILFVVYGVYIGANPVIVMNLFGFLVNVYHLVKLHRASRKLV